MKGDRLDPEKFGLPPGVEVIDAGNGIAIWSLSEEDSPTDPEAYRRTFEEYARTLERDLATGPRYILPIAGNSAAIGSGEPSSRPRERYGQSALPRFNPYSIPRKADPKAVDCPYCVKRPRNLREHCRSQHPNKPEAR